MKTEVAKMHGVFKINVLRIFYDHSMALLKSVWGPLAILRYLITV